MQGIMIFKLFMDGFVFNLVFFLALLSALLIYSLMLSDIDEKTYELGMLRTLGLPKIRIIVLILIEAMGFALPGLGLGLLLAYMFNTAIA